MIPQTYIHRFSNGLTVKATIDSAKVARGDRDALNFYWSRTPTRAENDALQEEYIAWKSIVMQRVSNETGMRILDLVQVGPNDWLPRAFEPQDGGGAR